MKVLRIPEDLPIVIGKDGCEMIEVQDRKLFIYTIEEYIEKEDSRIERQK